MTHDEMRRQLAWAQGWTDITTGSDGDLYGSPPGTADPDEWDTVPDPLEDDSDAALLRAWVAKQGWAIRSTIHPLWAVSAIHTTGLRHARIGTCTVLAQTEPDLCRRERLALCWAVLKAIEAAES